MSLTADFAPVGSATATVGTMMVTVLQGNYTAPASGNLDIVLNSLSPGVSLSVLIDGTQVGSTITTSYVPADSSYEGGTEIVPVSGYTTPFSLEMVMVFQGTSNNGGLDSGTGTLYLPVPEPATMSLVAVGLLGTLTIRRRKA